MLTASSVAPTSLFSTLKPGELSRRANLPMSPLCSKLFLIAPQCFLDKDQYFVRHGLAHTDLCCRHISSTCLLAKFPQPQGLCPLLFAWNTLSCFI